MLGYIGTRSAHVGAELFIDAADDRSWGGATLLQSLAGTAEQRYATLAGAWVRLGTPAPLARIERWYAH